MRSLRSLALASLLFGCSSSPSKPPAGGETTGCDDTPLLANPADPAARGPWAVGAKTVMVGSLKTEVWYPATPGSDAGKTPERYDIRTELPASEATKISDADNPWQVCDCVRDLPLDAAHGPYPVIVFVHGTASFRHQSLTFATHWASRGFVVVAADHPGLKLGDLLAQACGGPTVMQNLGGDVDQLLGAVASPAGDLAFLASHVDATRIAVAGHSAGGGAAAMSAGKPGVEVVIAMAGATKTPMTSTPTSALYLGGMSDMIASVGQVRTAYDGSPSPRRFAALANAGHLNFSDLCDTKNSAGQDLLAIAKTAGVCGADLAGFLFDCSPDHLPGPRGWAVVNGVTSSVLEPALQCAAATDVRAYAMGQADVAQYDEKLAP